MGTRQLMRARVIAVALVGIALAACISVAASAVSSPRVGLASEPPSVGHGLVAAPGQPATPLPAGRPATTHHEATRRVVHDREEREEAARGEAPDADD